MEATDVKRQVEDNSIWRNSLWINKKEKVYFVPIWRNGNTSFMHLAEDNGFELTRMTQCHLNSYTGFAFIRHPMKRITGQLYRAYENNNSENIMPEMIGGNAWEPKDYKDASLVIKGVEELLEEAKKGNFMDAHMIPQYKFLENYSCKYIIDLDKKSTVSHPFINKVLVDFYSRDSGILIDGVYHHRQQTQDRFIELVSIDEETVKDIYEKDYELYESI